MGSRALGIDVSHYHPVKDFGAVLDAGAVFFGIKATEGRTFKDPTWKDHMVGARQVPFKLVVYYHFARSGDAKGQAHFLMDTIGPLRGNERLCLDFEDDSTGKPTVDLPFLDAFYTELLGGVCSDRKPLIYTSKRVWDQIGGPAWNLASEIDLWAPRYGNDEPVPPAPWKAWTFWQWSDKGTLPKVPGTFDMNYFAGDAAALDAYVKGQAPISAPAPLVA